MQCSEMDSDGLHRTFRVVIPASKLQERLDARIAEVGPKVQIKGFRAGKVPASHIKKLYGPSIIREIIDEEVRTSTQATLAENSVRVAGEPHLHLETDIEQVAAGKADLAFHFHVEVMPDFEPVDPATMTIDKQVSKVTDEQVDEQLAEIAKANRDYQDKDGAAADGDALTIDFVGKIDGEAFQGGSAEGAPVVIGSKQFIPGFEEQLIGVKAGDEKVLNVSFPEDYGVADLKGKAATFDVKVQSVKEPKDTELNDEFAKRLGLNTLEEVRDALRQRIEAEHAAQSRAKAKRKLFDQLDEMHDFELPTRMVDAEFGQIWRQIEADKQADRLDPEDAGKSTEELEGEYRRIAQRRVRLGLLLAEIGRRNNVQIREDEVAAAVGAQARQFPGQERQVVEFYQKNPNALAQIRAPLYEEKVVDFIMELAKTNSTEVSRDELFADEEPPAPKETKPKKAKKAKAAASAEASAEAGEDA